MSRRQCTGHDQDTAVGVAHEPLIGGTVIGPDAFAHSSNP